jgi:RNA polymerase sigma-70 factor (ECF subfamily)
MSETSLSEYFYIMMAKTDTSRRLEDQQTSSADLVLTIAAGKGDRSSRRKLVYRVMPRVRKTVCFLAKNREDAEDLAQLALLQVLGSAGSFRGECDLDFWVDRIVLQTLAKQFQRRTRRERILNRYWKAPPSPRAVDEQVAVLEVRERIIVLLGTLKEKERVPVVLRYVYGYGIPEIADLTQTKSNTVRGRLRTGVSRLRKLVLRDPALCEWLERGKK